MFEGGVTMEILFNIFMAFKLSVCIVTWVKAHKFDI